MRILPRITHPKNIQFFSAVNEPSKPSHQILLPLLFMLQLTSSLAAPSSSPEKHHTVDTPQTAYILWACLGITLLSCIIFMSAEVIRDIYCKSTFTNNDDDDVNPTDFDNIASIIGPDAEALNTEIPPADELEMDNIKQDQTEKSPLLQTTSSYGSIV